MKIYDCNNYVRMIHEVDSSGLALRNLWSQAHHSPEPEVYVFDGMKSRQMRQAIFPSYKSKRKPGSDNFYEVLNVFKKLIRLTNKISIEIPGWEADDVIAHLCRTNPITKFEIQSTDKDFAVLHNEYVSQNRPGLEKVDATDVRLYKTLVGDKSDNIPGITGFGDKAWEKLTQFDKECWVKLLTGEVPEFDPRNLTSRAVDLDLLKVFWKIVGFFEVPAELLAKHTTVGVPNFNAAQLLLREVMQ